MFLAIQQYAEDLCQHFDEISAGRKLTLDGLAEYISFKRKQNNLVNLVYICTHNSRRSHFGQIWAKVASVFYHIDGVNTFSGGTESTAFNANAVGALKQIGFRFTILIDGHNPVYEVLFDEMADPIICFSKTYNHPTNPQNNFAAIMTCSEADENCPLIKGADLKFACTYEDPKDFDNTHLQDQKYNERCRQIALETFYLFSRLN
ncbi:MAG: protein-tyrosine-phosphatase [bacterium]|nr:protein-tyrosine-phosphatase [bacterium]